MTRQRIWLIVIAAALAVSVAARAKTRPFVVSGRITLASGRAAENVRVTAYTVTSNGAAALGQTVTDSAGRYRITFESPDESLHLQIHVSTRKAGELGRSDIHHNAAPPLVIDCVLR